MDRHEDHYIAATFVWVVELAMIEVRKYLESVKKYPNPPAPNMTVFRQDSDVVFVRKALVSYRTLTRYALVGALVGFCVIGEKPTNADEGGVSFWLPGTFGSLSAVPATPGWSLAVINYYTSVTAGGPVAAARLVTIGGLSSAVNVSLNANLKSNENLVLVNPSYVFATPVLGGQFALGMTGIVGANATSLSGSLTASEGPLVILRQGTIDSSVTNFGDLSPQATLSWNNGVNNWMTYVTGDIPVGEYSSTSLANIGIGHGAIDGGGGYTYFDPQTGHEFSVVTGLTGNFTNPSTGYTNGIDWHADWGASQFLNKQLLVGAVGYFYEQITPDNGCHPSLCPFESRVIGVGPQIGYLFPVGKLQGYINVKAYGEFAAQDRPYGWNAWVTFSLSPVPATASPPIVIK